MKKIRISPPPYSTLNQIEMLEMNEYFFCFLNIPSVWNTVFCIFSVHSNSCTQNQKIYVFWIYQTIHLCFLTKKSNFFFLDLHVRALITDQKLQFLPSNKTVPLGVTDKLFKNITMSWKKVFLYTSIPLQI